MRIRWTVHRRGKEGWREGHARAVDRKKSAGREGDFPISVWQTLAPHLGLTPHRISLRHVLGFCDGLPSSVGTIARSSLAFDPQGGSNLESPQGGSYDPRICAHLPSSGFRRDGPQSLPHRAGLTRARMGVFSSMRGGEKMKRSIRLGRCDLPFFWEIANAPSSVAIDLSGRREFLKISINSRGFSINK